MSFRRKPLYNAESFLTQRKQAVVVGNQSSQIQDLTPEAPWAFTGSAIFHCFNAAQKIKQSMPTSSKIWSESNIPTTNVHIQFTKVPDNELLQQETNYLHLFPSFEYPIISIMEKMTRNSTEQPTRTDQSWVLMKMLWPEIYYPVGDSLNKPFHYFKDSS